MNNNAENHNPSLEEKLCFFFSNDQMVDTEGRIIETLSLGNIAQFEAFKRDFPKAFFAARKKASDDFELPEDKFTDGWFKHWIEALTDRDAIHKRVEELGFDPHDPSIFLTFDLRLEKVNGPYAIDIDVRLDSQEQKFLNQLPVVLGFNRVKLLVERDLKT